MARKTPLSDQPQSIATPASRGLNDLAHSGPAGFLRLWLCRKAFSDDSSSGTQTFAAWWDELRNSCMETKRTTVLCSERSLSGNAVHVVLVEGEGPCGDDTVPYNTGGRELEGSRQGRG